MRLDLFFVFLCQSPRTSRGRAHLRTRQCCRTDRWLWNANLMLFRLQLWPGSKMANRCRSEITTWNISVKCMSWLKVIHLISFFLFSCRPLLECAFCRVAATYRSTWLSSATELSTPVWRVTSLARPRDSLTWLSMVQLQLLFLQLLYRSMGQSVANCQPVTCFLSRPNYQGRLPDCVGTHQQVDSAWVCRKWSPTAACNLEETWCNIVRKQPQVKDKCPILLTKMMNWLF